MTTPHGDECDCPDCFRADIDALTAERDAALKRAETTDKEWARASANFTSLLRQVETLKTERDEARSLLQQYELVMTADDHQIVRDLADAQQVGRVMRAEAAKAIDARDEAEMRYATGAVENDRLRALLREVEWMGSEHETMCPSCGCMQWKGHAPDCRLAAALEGRDGVQL
jgi:DNA repair exonuclease SbcCD ATPase subunit